MSLRGELVGALSIAGYGCSLYCRFKSLQQVGLAQAERLCYTLITYKVPYLKVRSTVLAFYILLESGWVLLWWMLEFGK